MKTYTVEKGDLVSINSVLSIPVGTRMDIVNESYYHDIYIKASVIEPPANREGKRSLTQRDHPESYAYVETGSNEVWLYSPHGRVTVSVQVL